MTTQQQEFDILPLFDLQQRNLEEQKKHVEAYRKVFTNKEITDFWGKKESFMYGYMKKIGVKAEYKSRTPKQKKAPSVVKPKAEKAIEEDRMFTEVAKEYAEQTAPLQAIQAPPAPVGFGFNINGTYNAEKLIKRLEKLSLILEDEDAEFEVQLAIKEKVETV